MKAMRRREETTVETLPPSAAAAAAVVVETISWVVSIGAVGAGTFSVTARMLHIWGFLCETLPRFLLSL